MCTFHTLPYISYLCVFSQSWIIRSSRAWILLPKTCLRMSILALISLMMLTRATHQGHSLPSYWICLMAEMGYAYKGDLCSDIVPNKMLALTGWWRLIKQCVMFLARLKNGWQDQFSTCAMSKLERHGTTFHILLVKRKINGRGQIPIHKYAEIN